MKPAAASFIAMVAGWVLPLLGLALSQLATSGRTTDVLATAFWVGLFALIAWAAAVLPMVMRFGKQKLISDPRWSWLGWSGLGVATFTVLLTPIMGRDAFLIVWYPALMGGIAGFVFALLSGKHGKNSADQSRGPTAASRLGS